MNIVNWLMIRLQILFPAQHKIPTKGRSRNMSSRLPILNKARRKIRNILVKPALRGLKISAFRGEGRKEAFVSMEGEMDQRGGW